MNGICRRERSGSIQDFPEFSAGEYTEPEMDQLIDQIISTSECPIHELAQDRSFYSPATDEIILPLRSEFKDQTSFPLVQQGYCRGNKTRDGSSLKTYRRSATIVLNEV